MSAITQQLNTELAVVRKEMAPFVTGAAHLAVSDAQSYAVADSFLTKLVTARKTVKARLSKILDPLKEALREAQGLLSEVDNPLAEAERIVRIRMKDFKLEEARQARIEEDKKQEEAEELRRQANAKALAESKAKTQQMRDKLAAQRAELETKADVAETAYAPTLVKAAGSTTRAVKMPRITDAKAVLAGILAGRIPFDVVEFDLAAIKAYYRHRPAEVEQWPGVEMIDDIQIVYQNR